MSIFNIICVNAAYPVGERGEGELPFARREQKTEEGNFALLRCLRSSVQAPTTTLALPATGW